MSKKITITESDIRKIVKTVCARILNEGVNTNGVLNKIYVSYGADKYDAQKFQPVDPNNEWANIINKPVGGIWASPLNKDFGTHWGDWCSKEQFRQDTFQKHFRFKLSPDAKIYVLSNIQDLVKISTRKNRGHEPSFLYPPMIDIGELVKNYDGVYITKDAAYQLKYTNHSKMDMVANLDSWDVESICVFNPDVIVPIDENLFDKAKINDYTKQDTWSDEYFGRCPEYDKYLVEPQKNHDYNLYGNRNVDSDMSKAFNGKHPAILAQGDGRRTDTKQARAFNGTVRSGLKEGHDLEEDTTLYHGTRADFNQFDLAYLSSGWGQQDWGYGVYLTDYPDCAKEYGRSGMIYTVQVPDGKYLNDQRISPTEANNIARNFFKYYLNTDYGKEAYGSCPNEFWEYECSYIGKSVDGLTLYGSISQILGSDEEASKYLDSIGYVGLKYRGENRDNGKKFWNYVIFDPSKIKIVNKEQI